MNESLGIFCFYWPWVLSGQSSVADYQFCVFRALVLSMVEILFSCGNGKSAVVSSLDVFSDHIKDGCEGDLKNEVVAFKHFSV